MQTAGRTVLFSALTVGLSLAALMVFPVYFLRSFAYAGIAVVALATVAALVLLPAMLTVLGPRVDSLDLRGRAARAAPPEPVIKSVEDGFWYRFAHGVMKRALPVGLFVTAVLVGLGLPFLHAHYAYPDDRVLPHSASAHQVGDDLRTQFATNAGSTMTVVAADIGSAPSALGGYAARLSRVAHVTSVSSAAGVYAGGGRVAPGTGRPSAPVMRPTSPCRPTSRRSRRRPRRCCPTSSAVPAPWPVHTAGRPRSTGTASTPSVRPCPIALGPDRARVVRRPVPVHRQRRPAPQGAGPEHAVAVGHLRGDGVGVPVRALRFAVQRPHDDRHLVPTMPPLMFCLAFGLSMDYEVFLLSRIREAWLESGARPPTTPRRSPHGLGRTGRIVTAAALLMAIVFAGMASSKVSFMMLFGTGLTLAVIMDATVVRGILVPAFMRLAGRWNWWAPRPLARLHERFGLSEGPACPYPTRAGPGRSRMTAVRKHPGAAAARGRGEDLRGEIVAATKELLAEAADSDAVSIRAVAEAVGVTPPSIYLHFADKNQLLEAVVVDVFAELDTAMMAAAERPRARSSGCGRSAWPMSASPSSIPSTTGWRRWSAARSHRRDDPDGQGAGRGRVHALHGHRARLHGRRDLRRRRPHADDAAVVGGRARHRFADDREAVPAVGRCRRGRRRGAVLGRAGPGDRRPDRRRRRARAPHGWLAEQRGR